MLTTLQSLTASAENRWLESWMAGPTEDQGVGLPSGATAPDLVLLDHEGVPRHLSDLWARRPALVMFWRHFGCGCGVDRAHRLRGEYEQLRAAGLEPVIVGQGEPARAAAYRAEHDLPCPVLCDPDHMAYRAYGIGHWGVERVLYDAEPAYWGHPRELGVEMQTGRRAMGRPLVDDPWRATAELVIGAGGVVRLCYLHQSCEDFPDARVLTTAARLSRP